MAEPANGNGNGQSAFSWKIDGPRWLLNQGPVTVLLFLLVAGGFHYTPQWLTSIQTGYEKLATQNRETIKERDASFERSIKMLTDSWEREREFLRERRLGSPAP